MQADTESRTHVAQQSRLVTEIFAMMAAITVVPRDLAWPPKGPLLAARVGFSGTWEGSMILECTLPLAFAFTASFMSLRRPEEVNDDVSDVIAELTNTIAGNFKALLPSGCKMSIPSVALFADGVRVIRSPRTMSTAIFDSEQGACCVILEGGSVRPDTEAVVHNGAMLPSAQVY